MAFNVFRAESQRSKFPRALTNKMPALSIGVTLVLSTLTAPATAFADTAGCVDLAAISRYSWIYRVCDMPDIDQDRVGLPNTGSQYCAPTASANVLFWLDNRGGYTNLLTGSYSPISSMDPDYSEVTAKVQRLGVRMVTDAYYGTTHDNVVAGLESLIAEKGYSGYLRVGIQEFQDRAWYPWNVGRRLVELGSGRGLGVGVLIGVIGRYDAFNNRVGGHLLTIARVNGDDLRTSITFHNPADGGDQYTQSAVTPRTYNLGSNSGFGPTVLGYSGDPFITGRLDKVVWIQRVA